MVLREKTGNDVGDHAHGRQDHDVDRRVGVDPEQVLEQDRVAALRRIEEADAEDALDDDQQQGDARIGVARIWTQAVA